MVNLFLVMLETLTDAEYNKCKLKKKKKNEEERNKEMCLLFVLEFFFSKGE